MATEMYKKCLYQEVVLQKQQGKLKRTGERRELLKVYRYTFVRQVNSRVQFVDIAV